MRVLLLICFLFISTVSRAESLPRDLISYLKQLPEIHYGPQLQLDVSSIFSQLNSRDVTLELLRLLKSKNSHYLPFKSDIVDVLRSCCSNNPVLVLNLIPVIASLDTKYLKQAISVIENSDRLDNNVANALSFALGSDVKISFKLQLRILRLLLRTDSNNPRSRWALEKILVQRIETENYDEVYKETVAYLAAVPKYKRYLVYKLNDYHVSNLSLRHNMVDKVMKAYADNWLHKVKCYSAESMTLIPPELLLLKSKTPIVKRELFAVAEDTFKKQDINRDRAKNCIKLLVSW